MTEPTVGKILVGVDGSAASRDALDWACSFGVRSGLEVRAVMAWHYPAPHDESEEPDPRTREMVREHLEEVVSGVSDSPVELEVVEGQAAVALAQAASRPDVALLAIGRRGLGSLPDLLLGSVARSVLHGPPCPVVLVPKRPEAGWPDPSTMVLGIDGSELSADVLSVACALSGAMDVEATVVHCVDIGAEFSSHLLQEIVARTRADVSERWCADLKDSGKSVAVDVRNEEARRGIVAAAEEVGAGLVVVGLHGAGQFRGIGGTTSYLARHLEAPLVVVPPGDSTGQDLGYRL